VRKAGIETPISTTNGDKVHLGVDDASTDSGGNFLRGFNTKSDVSIAITDGDVTLKPSALTSRSLFLHGHNLHYFVSHIGAEKKINNLVFLDREREEKNFFNGFNFSISHETA